MFVAMAATSPSVESFATPSPAASTSSVGSSCSVSVSFAKHRPQHLQLHMFDCDDNEESTSPKKGGKTRMEQATKAVATAVTTAAISAAFVFHAPFASFAEDELAAKYGGGLDTSLVDQTCLVDKCSLQAKACLADDPSCRKGLTCTAKCLGDNACITGCMARYGDKNLDNLLKCSIEDNECIKVAILDGGADKFGQEPKAPAPTIRNFDVRSMEGSWYKVVGYNPNYDCYACQRNTFSTATQSDKLKLDVEFSMPHMLPDGTPAPPTSMRREVVAANDDGLFAGASPIAFNDYETHETMVFDDVQSPLTRLVMGKGTEQEATYARTAHSEGEMFGLKFWENWYVLGENDPGDPEFKFVYYNGKTRQNTYEGAFVYSRQRELPKESMAKVYQLAKDAGMNPENFCKIRNGCFQTEDSTIVKEPESGLGAPSNPFRGILASTKVSQFFGVEPVAAENLVKRTSVARELMPDTDSDRAWWYEVGDYLENPHRHFAAMNDLRVQMDWPEDVVNGANAATAEQPLN